MKQNSVLTFLAGAALGAGLAILFAPRSGEETRRRIRERVKRDYDSVKGMVNSAGQRVREGMSEAAGVEENR